MSADSTSKPSIDFINIASQISALGRWLAIASGWRDFAEYCLILAPVQAALNACPTTGGF